MPRQWHCFRLDKLVIQPLLTSFLLTSALLTTAPVIADDINSYEPTEPQLANKPNQTEHSAERKAELKKLRGIIVELQQELDTAKSDKEKLRTQLRDHEKVIGVVTKEVKKLGRQLRKQKKKLSKLVSKEKKLRVNLYKNKDSLRQQIRSAYTIGSQDYVKLLLNQQDPGSIGRMLSYYDYFIKVRANNINTVKDKISEINQLQLTIKQKKSALENTRNKRSKDIRSLKKSKSGRKLVLSKLNKEIQTKTQKLEKVKEDERRLQQLVIKLQRALADIPDYTDRSINFAQQKGKLHWPAKGSLRKRYGTSRRNGKLKWQGVVINTREGDPVSAISHGQVAFADWLQGYGLLIIIDHGDNYMSLYGFNQSLLKEAGDWIETGEIIASAGISGGNTKSGLYFEIRHNGKPTNPGRWCSNTPANKKSARR